MRNLILCLISLCSVLVVSCDNYDTWTTDADAQLVFSPDTVRFDTLLITVPSSTKTMMVYNGNKAGLRISNISLRNGSNSIFRVNVDGSFLAGGHGSDYEVRTQDSIFVRIECTGPVDQQEEMAKYEDDLQFQLESGVVQNVHLEASMMKADFQEDTLMVTEDTCISTTRPLVLKKGIYVAENAKLTILPGSELYFSSTAGITVDGSIDIQGTMENRVVLRGDRMGRMFDYLLYDNTPGRWGGITLTSYSHNNRFNYMDLHSASFGIEAELTDVDIDNSIIYNVSGHGVALTECNAQITNTQISNTMGHSLFVLGGKTVVTHCTLAQFYPFDSGRGMALYVGDFEPDNEKVAHWIDNAYFFNSIITGYGDDVFMARMKFDKPNDPVDIKFANCLINTVGIEQDERYVSCQRDSLKEGNFKLVDINNILYDFTPDTLSKARKLGDAQYIQKCPVDINGISRAEYIDAGAYQSQILDTLNNESNIAGRRKND